MAGGGEAVSGLAPGPRPTPASTGPPQLPCAHRKREERLRKVLQARERVEQMKEEKKKQIEQKFAQIEEKTEKVQALGYGRQAAGWVRCGGPRVRTGLRGSYGFDALHPSSVCPWAQESILSQAEGGEPVPHTEQQPFVRGLGLLCRVLGPTL